LALLGFGADLGFGAVGSAQTILRVNVSKAGDDSHKLGHYLARISPSTMLSRFAVGLITAGQSMQLSPELPNKLSDEHVKARSGSIGAEIEHIAHIADSGA
jgi:hypothetical protein